MVEQWWCNEQQWSNSRLVAKLRVKGQSEEPPVGNCRSGQCAACSEWCSKARMCEAKAESESQQVCESSIDRGPSQDSVTESSTNWTGASLKARRSGNPARYKSKFQPFSDDGFR